MGSLCLWQIWQMESMKCGSARMTQIVFNSKNGMSPIVFCLQLLDIVSLQLLDIEKFCDVCSRLTRAFLCLPSVSLLCGLFVDCSVLKCVRQKAIFGRLSFYNGPTTGAGTCYLFSHREIPQRAPYQSCWFILQEQLIQLGTFCLKDGKSQSCLSARSFVRFGSPLSVVGPLSTGSVLSAVGPAVQRKSFVCHQLNRE
jgi:hypothetical protein